MNNIRNILIFSYLYLFNIAFAQENDFVKNIINENYNLNRITDGGRKGYAFYISSCFDIKSNYNDKKYTLLKINYKIIQTFNNHIFSIGTLFDKKNISYCLRIGESIDFLHYNPIRDVFPRFFSNFLLNANLGYNTDFKNHSYLFIPEIGFSNKNIRLSANKECFLTFNVLYGVNIPLKSVDYLYERKFTPYLSIEVYLKGLEFFWDSF